MLLNSWKGLLVVLVTLLAGAGVLACRRKAMPAPDSPRATIWVQKDGAIELDGKPSTIEAVGAALTELVRHKGVLLYGRDAPSEDPHPNGTKVIQMVVSNRLPIRMSTKRDFSDAVGPDGKLR